MLTHFGLLDTFSLLKRRNVCIDSTLTTFNSRFTPFLFLIGALLLGAYQVFGNPISCTSDNHFKTSFVDSYCWTTSTESSLPGEDRNYSDELNMKGIPFPYLQSEKEVLHTYYQWTSLILLVLAAVSRIPHLLWKYLEGNLLRTLIPEGVDRIQLMDLEGEAYTHKLVLYLAENMKSRRHKNYGFWFVATETLNLVSALANIFILHSFFDGRFLQFGVNFVQHHLGGGTGKENTLFPLLARCRIYRSGPSGSRENFEETCVLIVNLINQEVFLVVWFFLAFLTIFISLGIVSRCITVYSVSYRVRSIRILTGSYSRISGLVEKIGFGDWIILKLLLGHFQVFFAKGIVTELARSQGLLQNEGFVDAWIPDSRTQNQQTELLEQEKKMP